MAQEVDTFIDPLPLNVWNELTAEQRQAHIAKRNERQDIAAELIASRGIEIIVQSSGAFRNDWSYDDLGDQMIETIVDTVFSSAFH